MAPECHQVTRFKIFCYLSKQNQGTEKLMRLPRIEKDLEKYFYIFGSHWIFEKFQKQIFKLPFGTPKTWKNSKKHFFCWNCNKINWFGKGSFKILFLRKKVPFLEVPLLGREITDFVFGISGKFNGAQKLKKKFRVNFRFLTTSSIFFFENIDFRISLE